MGVEGGLLGFRERRDGVGRDGGGLCESVLPLQGDLNCFWCVSPPGPAARAATCRACSPPEVVALNSGCVFAPHRAALQGQNVIARAASPGGRPPPYRAASPEWASHRDHGCHAPKYQRICGWLLFGPTALGNLTSASLTHTKPRRRKKSKSAGNLETFVASCEIPWSCTDSGPLVWPARSRSTS